MKFLPLSYHSLFVEETKRETPNLKGPFLIKVGNRTLMSAWYDLLLVGNMFLTVSDFKEQAEIKYF